MSELGQLLGRVEEALGRFNPSGEIRGKPTQMLIADIYVRTRRLFRGVAAMLSKNLPEEGLILAKVAMRFHQIPM